MITVRILILIICSYTIAYNQITPRSHKYQEGTPIERYEWDVLRLQDPTTQTIPDNVSSLEKKFALQSQQHNKKFSQLQASHSVAVHQVGPSNVGGRTRTMAIDRTRPNIMLAGGVTGGIWRSIDTGATWTRVSPFNDIHNISCIVQSASPADGSVWYAGTGEMLSTTERRTSTNLRTIGTGSGIYRSTDRGLTWQLIEGTQVSTQRNKLGSPFSIVWNLLPIDYNKNGNAVDGVVACCYGGVYSIVFTPTLVISPILTDSSKPFINSDIVSSGKNYFISISSADDGTKPSVYGIWKLDITTSEIKNITPQNFPNQIRRFKMALAPSDAKTIYVYSDSPTNWNLRYQDFGSIYKLWQYTDVASGVGTWIDRSLWINTMIKKDNSFRSLAGYSMCLAVHPTNPKMVFLGGTNLCRTSSGFSDTNDFVKIGGYPYIVAPGRLHPDIHSLLFAPNNNKQLYATCDGGIFVLDNSNSSLDTTWRDKNNGLMTTQVYGATINRNQPNSNVVIAGLQDNSNFVTTSTNVTTPWEFGGGGDGCTNDVYKDGNIFFASSQTGYTYALMRDNTGELQYSDFGPPQAINSISNRAFVTLQKLTPNYNALFLALGNKLYRYNNPENATVDKFNHEKSWNEITAVGKNNASTSLISAIAFTSSSDLHYFFGTSAGKVFRVNVENGDTIVTPMSSPKFPANAFVSSIDVDSRNENHIIVSFSNYNVESIFITTDGGDTWQSFGLNLEDSNKTLGWGPSVRVVKIIPAENNQTLYLAGTSTGLYSHFTSDTTKPWVLEAPNVLGNITIESLDFRLLDNRIAIGTHGAGVFSGSISFIPTTNVQELTPDYYSICTVAPNPTNGIPKVHVTMPKDEFVTITIFNSIGQAVLEIPTQFLIQGVHTLDLQTTKLLTMQNDVYYVKMVTPSFTTTTSFVLEK